MQNPLERSFRVLHLVVLAVLAYLSGRVVNTLITERNVFDSGPEVAGVAPVGPAEAPPLDRGPDENDPTCRPSDGPLDLLATRVAEAPAGSTALVNDGTPESRLVKEGQKLGAYTVSTIHRQRLVLARDGGYTCLELGTRRPEGETTASGDDTDTPAVMNGITRLADNRYRIDRKVLNAQLDDLESLSREARVIPHYEGGRPLGFKIIGVRAGSLYSELGLRSGDVLLAANGMGMGISSPNKALEIYETLKNVPVVTLELTRRGRPLTLTYTIE